MKRPEIWPDPPVIGDRIRRRRDHLVVEHDREQPPDVLRGRLAEALGAADVELEVDDRLAGAVVEARLGVGEVAALDDDAALDRLRLARRLLRRQQVDVRRAGLRHHAELELRGLAEDLLQPLRILEARNLHQDAVGALALDVRLGRAERVDAPAQDLDRLIDGAAHPVVEPLLGQRELEQAVRALGDIDVARAGLAEDDVRDRLRQLAQLRRDAGPLVRVGDAQLDAALGHLDAALDRGAVVAQRRGARRRGAG